jgi:hypothetical protein
MMMIASFLCRHIILNIIKQRVETITKNNSLLRRIDRLEKERIAMYQKSLNYKALKNVQTLNKELYQYLISSIINQDILTFTRCREP